MLKRSLFQLIVVTFLSLSMGSVNAANRSDGFDWYVASAFSGVLYYRTAGQNPIPEPLVEKVCELFGETYTATTGKPATVTYSHSVKLYPGNETQYDSMLFGCFGGTETGGWYTGVSYFRLEKSVPSSTPPEPEITYDLKISPITTAPYGSYITSIDPRLPVRLLLSVKDSNGNPAKIPVDMEVSVLEGTGGHIQKYHEDRNPDHSGQLKVGSITGRSLKNIEIDKIQEFEFRSPEKIAGDYKIKLTCPKHSCTIDEKDTIWSGVKGLTLLPNSSDYTKIGDTEHHPVNHYATETTIKKITKIAKKYHEEFPTLKVLHINDISLERGGLFDIGKRRKLAKWKTPHSTHMTGTDVDIRANEKLGNTDGAIPEENYIEFERIARSFNCTPEIHSSTTPNEHYHLKCKDRL